MLFQKCIEMHEHGRYAHVTECLTPQPLPPPRTAEPRSVGGYAEGRVFGGKRLAMRLRGIFIGSFTTTLGVRYQQI